MHVVLGLPTVLAGLAAGPTLTVPLPEGATVADLLDVVRHEHPAVERRIRDETGSLRRFVNVYVDGDDVRLREGLATGLHPGAEVLVIPSVAGG